MNVNEKLGGCGRSFLDALKSQMRPAILTFVLLVVVTGLIYPAVTTGLAQVAFDHEANGSLIYDENGNVIGSELIGQYVDEEEYPELFWPRPSAINYDASTSGGNNWGEKNPDLEEMIQKRVDLLLKYNELAGVENTMKIPSDLVTASSSGLDPHISYASAIYQMGRVLHFQEVDNGNHMTEEELLAHIDAATTTDGLGNKYVNVLKLNLSLDEDFATSSGAVPDVGAAGSNKVLGMTSSDWIMIFILIAGLAIASFVVSKFMLSVYEGKGRAGKRVEDSTHRICGLFGSNEGMGWKKYLLAVLLFNLFGFVLLFLVLTFQNYLPLNPRGLDGLDPYLAFNTAVSFVTNTNWQAYGGETTMSYFSQMFGLTVQNFLSAATGMAVLVALIRGLRNRSSKDLGNFWKDITKSVAILLPIALIASMVLVSQGVPQTFDDSVEAQLAFPYYDDDGNYVTTQTISYGPVASQESIKELGTNGGGFMNANSSHPYENPNCITNMTEIGLILLIPISVCMMFGSMVHDRRQGLAILAVMVIMFAALFGICASAEMNGNATVDMFDEVSQESTEFQYGGNLEGKEVRFGTVASAFFAVTTTATSCGAVNSMHDSYTAIGGMVPLLLMQLGEVCFGGVGCGLYGMLMFVIIAVFIAGLMVGRMPEYLGKKIGPREMKLASIAVIVPVAFILIGTAVAVVWPGALDSLNNPGTHGFSEILYAFSSATGNNGSAFAGLNANTPFFNVALAICMLAGRFIPIVLTLPLAGSMAEKKPVAPSAGTLPTHTPTFIVWLLCVVVLVGVLSFFLSLSLGPIAEALM